LKKQEALDDINKSKQEVLDKMSCFKAKVNEISDLQETTDVDKEQIQADLKKYWTMVDTKCKEIDNRQNEIELSVRNLLTYVKSLQSRFGENDAKQMAMEKHISEIRQTIDNHYIVKLVSFLFVSNDSLAHCIVNLV
jgi:DNA repair exonuclease SbcCD ATPase subunit